MDQEDTLDIAIIGMSARFPGAPNLDTFWENLRDGKESIRFFTDDELASYHATDDPEYVKAAPALDDIDKFDAAFFGYAPREAQMMDPQHRLLLECATSALEHSGYASDTYDGLISVFAGSAMNTYLLFSGLAPHYIDEYLPTLIGNDKDFLATRISYKLNLKGPSVTVQTACSTALVATHMACQSLLNGESDIALAGAVSVRVPHNAGHQYIPGSVFTPDGHCRPFDAKANGTIFGSGVGVVVLKRLDAALEDGDYIHAVIKGTAINNDGASKVDYTAPSVESQSEAIAEALGVSGVDASTISYVEAHGTGTAIGDPIEVAALTKAYRNYTDKNGFCAIGSVKSNIGHLDVAAGMAGMIKTILALKHKQLPPTLHYTEPNPEIHFDKTPFYVNDKLSAWDTQEAVRRAGVSALGIGGTNAHIILEEAPDHPPSHSLDKHHLLLWSAKTEEALDEASNNLQHYLINNPGVSLNDVAYTLQTGRNRFEHKRFMVAKNVQEAIDVFEGAKPGRTYSSAQKAASRELIFMFPGQGAQYVQMGRDLYEHETVFRETIDRCADMLRDRESMDLKGLLYPKEGDEHTATERLKQTKYTQPALFAVCYALAKQLEHWGIQAQGYIGHSIGEYVAACLAGVFSLEDALGIVTQRGKLMQDMPAGSMLAVSLAKQEIEAYLDDNVSLAAVNATELCVVSGTHEAIETLENTLTAQDIQAKRLHTSHGFHSNMMQPAADAFFEYLDQITLRPPSTPFISNLSGTWISAEQATDAQYWANHLRNAVLFEKGLHTLLQETSRVFVEVGPGRTLTSFLRMHPSRTKSHAAITSMRHPKDTESDQSVVLHALGNLWLNGVNPDWDALDEELNSRRIPLPTYPFKRQPHWFKSTTSQSDSPYIQAPTHKASRPDSILFAPGWKRAVPFPKAALTTSSTWLLFTDGSPFAEQLENTLKDQGHTVITVMVGSVFEQTAELSWTINPEERLHYDELLRSIKQAGQLPYFMVHAWNVNNKPAALERQLTQSSKHLMSNSFFSLLYLSQAIQQQDMVHPITMGVLSADVHDITGSEAINPIHATLHGPCRVIEKESPNIQCVQIDLETGSSNSPTSYIRDILSCIARPSAHRTLALRGKHFWVPEFSPITPDTNRSELPVKQKGQYLITGGLGGLGLAFANWLAKEYKATLFLLGRSPIPDKKEWPVFLNDATASSKVKAKIKALQHLESEGGTVIPVQANATNLEEMRQVLNRITKNHGALNGVIHTAGVIEDTLIPLKDANSAQRVLAPKVQGTLVLGHLLKDAPLDFFVLCSSINAYLSPAGQIDYTAANGFQDAFAHAHRQSTGINTISINWPGWKETGMLAEKKEAFGDQAWFKREYNRGILTDEGIEALKGALVIG
ncbi:MAG: SDR family NAD(P)-dependent oxidoreductase, partial [Rhodothermaceae bacterium]|nr:SDR family NAD(P)-dependent oxidoreductase [Rhodothermaceae bacterium]